MPVYYLKTGIFLWMRGEIMNENIIFDINGNEIEIPDELLNNKGGDEDE